MKSEWVTIPLGDVLTLQRGHDLPTQNRLSGEIPILGSSGITGFHNEAKATGPGVTVGRSGNSMGEISYSDKDFWPLNTALYVTDFKGNDPKFLYYLLQTIDFDQFNSGSAQKSLNRNAVYPFEVEIPKSRAEQERISSVLSSLEEKAGVNQKINQTLEQMAQATFKSWFFDFEPVKAKIAALEADGSEEDALLAAMHAISGKGEAELTRLQAELPEQYAELRATAELFPSAMQESELGEIPEGWSCTTLENLCTTITKGTTPKKSELSAATDDAVVPFIKVKDITGTGEIIREDLEVIPDSISRKSLKRSILKNGDLLFSIAGTIGRVAIVDTTLEDSNTNQAVGIIRLSEQEKHLALVWQTLLSERVQNEIRSKVVQGVQANASLKNLRDIQVVRPCDKLLYTASSPLSALLKEISSNHAQSRSLTELRDTLLPKLLSGELSVPDPDGQQVTAVETADV
jgi:type I restriction enzyme, S subunit